MFVFLRSASERLRPKAVEATNAGMQAELARASVCDDCCRSVAVFSDYRVLRSLAPAFGRIRSARGFEDERTKSSSEVACSSDDR